jgi:hypothetical protein
MNKTVMRLGVGAAVLLCLTACAAGSTDARAAAAGGDIPQFFLGVWHGIIAPITLIVEIVNRVAPHVLPWSPRFFEQGTGVAYDVGFFLALGGGPHIVINGWRRRRV